MTGPAICLIVGLLIGPASLHAAEPQATAFEGRFTTEIRPLLVKYCEDCHSEKLAEAELNLQAFAAVSDLRQHPQSWQKVGEMLQSRQMPPKDASQPNDQERELLQQWVQEFLTVEARAHAGDPGRVVLRRLSNAEYTYTIRDLTEIPSLNPAEEFPVDGAAGEGFTNTGNALVMSPALLTKYLDAAKAVAAHTVLLPDGFRFSSRTTRSDQTNEILEEIRQFYSRYTDSRAGEKVNLQGIVFETNANGGLPLGNYLFATVAEREALRSGQKAIDQVAQEHGLNSKYLGILWKSLNDPSASFVLDLIRAKWNQAQPADVPALVKEISAWQSGLWKFSSVGHIGKLNGPKSWQEPLTPLVTRQDLKFKIPVTNDGQPITVALIASDMGDDQEQPAVIWERPRLVAPGRPELPLKDVRAVMRDFAIRRDRIFASTAKCLEAVDDLSRTPVDVSALAKERGLDEEALRAWLEYLGVGVAPAEIQGLLTDQVTSTGNKEFIQGWRLKDFPEILANSSNEEAHIPGRSAPHGMVVHPAPQTAAAVGWRCPVDGPIKIEARVQPAHSGCGNGTTWRLELRRGSTLQRLASGVAEGGNSIPIGPFENIAMHTGDVIALIIGARNGNHSCDLTAIDLKLTASVQQAAVWDLAQDVSGDILAGNPHSDRQGHSNIWYFFSDKDQGTTGVQIPAGSLLASWQTATETLEKQQLAEQIQNLLSAPAPTPADSPDAQLYRELMSFDGPLFNGRLNREQVASKKSLPENAPSPDTELWGLDSGLFGKTPAGKPIDENSLCVRTPAIVQFQLPPGLAAGYELVVSGKLDLETSRDGSARLAITEGQLELPLGITAPEAAEIRPVRNRTATRETPILIGDGGLAQKRLQKDFEDFRNLFPVALCYSKVVPVDEVITLALFYREDDQLCRLMLDDAQKAELDRLWDELHYISQDALTQLDALAQILEYASQDADPKVFAPFQTALPIQADAFRQLLLESEPRHLEQLQKFAEQAYRRPLSLQEKDEFSQLYATLRHEELPHAEAFRLTLAKVLMSPDFLYHIEIPGPGAKASPISDWELASRMSYFLWSSQPDEELRQLAAAGKLSDSKILSQQMQRMLKDSKTRRLATEFACQWLHIYDFNHLDEKSEKQFPEFVSLRNEMYEESILFFQDLFQNNGAVTDILDADYTFLNEPLARHYGIEGITGPQWRRVEGIKARQRGGILAQATTLSKQSGASRTSPTLRGNWISEVLLGERLPRPPKDVPILPDDPSAFAGLTVRQIVEKHASDAKCAVCHVRVDPLGFSLEAFDAIGRHREKDAGNLPLETGVVMQDGTAYSGLEGLRNYLLTKRRDAFIRQFSKKMLGYALGRSVQLSDEPLLTQIQADLKTNNGHVNVVIESIVQSPQFREIRSRDAADED